MWQWEQPGLLYLSVRDLWKSSCTSWLCAPCSALPSAPCQGSKQGSPSGGTTAWSLSAGLLEQMGQNAVNQLDGIMKPHNPGMVWVGRSLNPIHCQPDPGCSKLSAGNLVFAAGFSGFHFHSSTEITSQKGPEFSVYFPLVQDIKLSLSQWTRPICGWSMFSRKIIHFELQIMANPPCPWELVPACKMCTWCPIQFNVVFTSRHQLSYFSSSSCYQVLPCSVFCAVIDSALMCLSKKIQMLITKAFPSSGTFPLLLTL